MRIRFEKRAGSQVLYCRIYINPKTEIRVSTGISCPGKFYKTTQVAQLPNGRTDHATNAQLELLSKKYAEFIVKYFEEHGTYPSAKEVVCFKANPKQANISLEEMFREYLASIPNETSAKVINSSINQYTEYCQDTSSIVPDAMRRESSMGFGESHTERLRKHFSGFRDHLYSIGLKDRSVRTRLSHISMAYRSVTSALEYMPQWKAIDPRLPAVQDDVIALDVEVVKQIKDSYTSMRPLLPKDLQKAYDYTIIGLITGWRHQSIVAINDGNVITTENGVMLKGVAGKNQQAQMVLITPLLNEALNNCLDMSGTLAPVMDASTINRSIKKLFKELGYTHNVSFIRNTSKKKEMITKPLYEWVSPHTLRRSAMTFYLKAGIDERTVKNIGGFAPGSASFNRYASYNEKDVAQAMAGMQ